MAPVRPLSRLPAAVVLALAVWLAGTPAAPAQMLPVKVKETQVGFRSPNGPMFKPGMFAPVYVTFEPLEKGSLVFPLEKDGFAQGKLSVSVADGDGIQGIYHADFSLAGAKPTTVMAYANASGLFPEFHLTVRNRNQTAQLPALPQTAMQLDQYLYLTVGGRSTDLHKALLAMSGRSKDSDTAPCFAAYENEVGRLPTVWFGYQAVDLLFLLTGDTEFVTKLAQDEARLAAIADWTRRGGRLVISTSWQNQEIVAEILKKNVWRPPVPPVVTPQGKLALTSLPEVTNFANAFNDLFPASDKEPVQVVRLKADPSAEMLLSEKDAPILARIPYGRGSITFVALEMDKAPFTTWKSRHKFWEQLVKRLGPQIRRLENPDAKMGGFMMGGEGRPDVTAALQRELDNFNVPQISFGWVALFILIFILIVGPLDYVILKLVFKRLEWTWITFPAVVIGITIISYFTAYALKGNDRKINQVDLVDIDLRTSLTDAYKPESAYAYGTTWFSILSPQIQDYTLGVQPALHTWAKDAPGNRAGQAGTVSWLGRPDPHDPGGMAKPGGASLFRRNYDYADEAQGLIGVPIPVWTTKAFVSSWVVPFSEMPFTVDFTYDPRDPDQKISGTVQSHLPVDLEDCYLIYGKKYYALTPDQTLPGRNSGGKAVTVNLAEIAGWGLDGWAGHALLPQPQQFRQWEPRGGQETGTFMPGPLVRRYYFFDETQSRANESNHSFRNLDQSWRVRAVNAERAEVGTAVIVGRLSRVEGDAERVLSAADPRVPAHLWIGALPGGNSTRPALQGTLTQETYVRIYVPIRPMPK